MTSSFQKELEELINRHSLENGSDTPDFILADYLCECLMTWNLTTRRREQWFGRQPKVVDIVNPPKP